MSAHCLDCGTEQQAPGVPGICAAWHVAPELSATEAATLARFDAAPDAEEALRERVALAIFHSVDAAADWGYFSDGFRDDYRQMADAAIAVMRGES